MDILVIIPSFYPAVIYGGTIVSSYNTAKSLAALGYDVSVLTTNTNMYSRLEVPCNEWQYMDGFRVKYYNETIVDKLSLPLLFSMWKEIKKADIIHIQAIFNTPTPIALFYSRLFHKPVILSPRGVMGEWILNQGNKGKRFWLKVLIKPFLKHVVWHATAEQEKNEILQHFPSACIEVIPNGIDLDKFEGEAWLSQTDFLKKWTHKEYSELMYIVTSLGRIHKKKGFDLLIKGFAELTCPNKILLIGGEDEGELDCLTKLVIDLKLEQTIFFVGKISEDVIKEFYIHSDVFALISHNENFGNVYAESLACGVPIIASIHTPWNEVVAEGCGSVVGLNVNEVTKALEFWKGYDKASVSRKARQYIRQFSWNSIGVKFDNLVHKIVDKSGN
ncbi:MAG: glycosyltransferase [Cytophagaceae bacterium]